MIKGQTVIFSANGVELGMRKLGETSWKRCQSQMQSMNSRDCSLRRRGILGKHGNQKRVFRSSLEDSIHLILYFSSAISFFGFHSE